MVPVSRMFRQARFRSLIPGLLLGLAAGAPYASTQPAPQTPAPLPEFSVLLREVREKLHSDEYLLDSYTFLERQTERQLDKEGRVKKVETSVYEVYPSAEAGGTYRRLVERDGKRRPAEDLARDDLKEQERQKKIAADPEVAARRAAKLAERRQKEAELIDDLFRVYEFRILGRESVEGRPAIRVEFSLKPGADAKTRGGKILQKFAGRAWIDEEDRQLVRVEGDLIEDYSIGFGVLAKLKKGAQAFVLRRKINDEIWLPAQARFVGEARVLLVKSLRIDATSEYSDYRKFSVGTESAVRPEENAK